MTIQRLKAINRPVILLKKTCKIRHIIYDRIKTPIKNVTTFITNNDELTLWSSNDNQGSNF